MIKSSMPREAIILCGGFGTRLQTVISGIAKPMAPVAGKPFLQYILDYLNNEHITHAILAVGYMRESVINYFGNAYKKIKITYSVEEEPLGTGGAIMQACKYAHNDELFVINGDTFFDISLEALYHFHFEKNALLTVALKKMEKFNRYGTVEINNTGKIVAFNEKKYVDEGLINGGIYCLNVKVFHDELPAKFSFEKYILEKEYKTGNVFGKLFNGYFIDIGIPEDYEKAQINFK